MFPRRPTYTHTPCAIIGCATSPYCVCACVCMCALLKFLSWSLWSLIRKRKMFSGSCPHSAMVIGTLCRQEVTLGGEEILRLWALTDVMGGQKYATGGQRKIYLWTGYLCLSADTFTSLESNSDWPINSSGYVSNTEYPKDTMRQLPASISAPPSCCHFARAWLSTVAHKQELKGWSKVHPVLVCGCNLEICHFPEVSW